MAALPKGVNPRRKFFFEINEFLFEEKIMNFSFFHLLNFHILIRFFFFFGMYLSLFRSFLLFFFFRISALK